MEHLSRETIEKFVRGEFPYPQLLEISAHLLGCSNQCQPILDRIDPNFMAKAENLETARINFAEQETHFSENEIEGYVSKSFGIEKRRQMNRHLTKCSICSQNLKNQDPDFLTNFIKDNLKQGKEPQFVVKGEETNQYFRFLVPITAFLLILVSTLAIIFLFPKTKNDDQVKLEDFPGSTTSANVEANLEINKRPNIIDNENKQTTELPSNIQTPNIKNDAKSKQSAKTSPVQSISRQTTPNNPAKRQDIIVKNRSLKQNCETNPVLAITPKDEIITDVQPNLSWKPLAKAVGYKIYLSDSENNLIEESSFPNEQKNSYKLNNKLQLNKKYEWKVVVILQDGKEIYSEPAYFSVGEKAKKLSKRKDKTKVNEVRCLKSQD